MRWRQQSVIFILQVLLPCLPTTLVTFVQGLAEAIAVILFAACQYSSCLLLLLVTVLAGANCKAVNHPVSRCKRARNMHKARACLALSVLKVGMQ
jgi:uncharacterized membrane protein YdjX (TVP38/TMEM64 family)